MPRAMSDSGSLTVSKLLSPGTINLNLKGADRDAVLGELVDQIPELARQPEARQTLLRALHEREQLHSTGIGDGIALPHARNALVGLVNDPMIVFGRHEQGVPYGSIDNIPARLFFLLIAPTVTQHLGMLARLSRLLRDPRLRQSLLAVDRLEKAIALIREAEEKMWAK
jgi:nitrogen PTS system EIIA component